MQRTVSAEAVQRIHLSDIEGDLNVHAWEQANIAINADEDLAIIQPEGDTLTLHGCSDSLELWVPFKVALEVNNIGSDVMIEGVRQLELRDVGGDVLLKNIREELTLHNLEGELAIMGAPMVRVGGGIAGDALFSLVRIVEVDDVQGDLTLKEVETATVRNVQGDLVIREGIASLHCSNVASDCVIRGNGRTELWLENVAGDLSVHGASSVQVSNVGSDCQIHDSAGATVILGNVGSDLSIVGAASVQVGNVGSDCSLRDIQGDVKVGYIGSDAACSGIAGNVQISGVGSDLQLKGIHGNIDLGNVGSDLHLQADFPAGGSTHGRVGGDASIVLPQQANLSIRAVAMGGVSGRSVVSSVSGNQVNMTYGDGSAQVELTVGGHLVIRGAEDPRSSSSNSWGWGDFGRDMADFGRDMANLGRDISREISASFAGAASSFSSDIVNEVARDAEERTRRFTEEQRRRTEHLAREQARRMEEQQRRAEEQRQRTEDQSKRASDKAERLHIRFHNREWSMEPGRIDRIVEQARRAASEGVLGALEAVEQALQNLSVTRPTSHVPPVTPEQATPPTSATAAASTPPEAGPETGSIEQEREAILRMIAEGRITPEEGDMLLEALG